MERANFRSLSGGLKMESMNGTDAEGHNCLSKLVTIDISCIGFSLRNHHSDCWHIDKGSSRKKNILESSRLPCFWYSETPLSKFHWDTVELIDALTGTSRLSRRCVNLMQRQQEIPRCWSFFSRELDPFVRKSHDEKLLFSSLPS